MSTDGAEELRAGLVELALARWPEASAVEVTDLTRRRGGASREAWSFDLAWGQGGERRTRPCFLLREAEEGLLDTDPSWEFDVMRAVGARGVPAPEALWLDAAGEHLGRPGLVMSRMPGTSERRVLLDPDRRADRLAVDRCFVETLAALHALDWQDLGLAFPHVPTAASAPRDEVERWVEVIARAEPDPEPGLTEVVSWMRDNAPEADRVVLVHGDYRYGNFLHDGAEITAVLDWELAHLGDPLEDLVWAFRPFRRGTEPFRSWSEVIGHYEEATGRPVRREALAFHRILSQLKSVGIAVTATHSFTSGRSRDVRMGSAVFGTLHGVRQMLMWIDEVEEP